MVQSERARRWTHSRLFLLYGPFLLYGFLLHGPTAASSSCAHPPHRCVQRGARAPLAPSAACPVKRACCDWCGGAGASWGAAGGGGAVAAAGAGGGAGNADFNELFNTIGYIDSLMVPGPCLPCAPSAGNALESKRQQCLPCAPP
jgi:hypothetical protein